jgi:hypothetical protein
MGLTSWDDADDNYDYQQLANNWQLVDFHDHTPSRGVPIPPGGLGAGAVLSQNIASGVIGAQHLSTALAEDLGVGTTGRGYLSIPTNQTTTSASYVYLSTQDIISGITMASNGLILVDYQALVSGIGQAIPVLNGSGIPIAVANGSPASASTATSFSSTDLGILISAPTGLGCTVSGSSNSSETTTGQLLGSSGITTSGTMRIWVPSGTYSIGVQFLATSGTVHVSNRHLWVRTENFV